jgi:hypothetical protein
MLIQSKPNLFICNADGKTPFTVINNNILMMKIMKKAMVTYARDTFEDSTKRPREYHFINQNLLSKLSEKYVYGSRMQSRR